MELVEINIAGRVHSVRACPFCGGTDLLPGLWSLENGEEDAIECTSCLGGAPLTAWLRPPADSQILASEESPGQLVWYECEARGWTEKNLSDCGGMTLETAIDLIWNRTPITPEIADALSKAFGTSAEMWLKLESNRNKQLTDGVNQSIEVSA